MPVQIGQKKESGFDNPLGLLSDCHRRIEHFLSVLIKACESARQAPLGPAELAALDKALQYFRESAPKHTADEEVSLFPRLRARGGQDAIRYMSALEDDHQAANHDHELVDSLGRRWIEQGILSEAEFSQMKQALDRLAGLYARHIQIEDREVFPLAGRVLPADQLAQIGREMAERRGVTAKRGR